MTKVVVYKDGKTHYIPTNVFGYGGLIEINGVVIDNPSSSKYLTSSKVTSIRAVTRNNVPVRYIHGDEVMSAVDYDARIEYLTHTFKEKIDEKYDEDNGGKINVCIWKNKDAEKEFYRLTNKFTCIREPVLTFSEYMDVEIVKLPKSPSAYIVPDWKTSDDIVTTCTFNRSKMVKETVDNLSKQFPSLKVANYVTNYEPNIYINDTKYIISGIPHYNSGVVRGELKACIEDEKRLLVEVTGYFNLELGKTKMKPLVNATTTLNAVRAIKSQMLYAKPKIAGQRYWEKGMQLIRELEASVAKEIVS